MRIEGTNTKLNLVKAFEIEAIRRTEYSIYSEIAESQGYKELSRLLKLYARNKDEHAKLWFKWINEGSLPSLIECFENALAKEQEKTKELYKNFAEIAKCEGIEHIAGLFNNLAIIETIHLERLQKVIIKLKDNARPDKEGFFNWTCSNCGRIFIQKEEPDYCQLCAMEDVFFYKI